MITTSEALFSCPVPIDERSTVTLAHGGGGTLMHGLIEKVFLAALRNPALEQRHDAAMVDVGGVKLAFTTDSYVVSPLFFPGGDIGSLAVHGTVNDLAMAGARPLYLSAGFVLEEGLPMDTLRRVVASMAAAARAAGVTVVTGDTKVVDRGKGDGLYVNTSGIGLIEHGRAIAPALVRPGDVVLVSGDVGRHGIAVMVEREGLQFESAIESDSAPVADVVAALLDAGIEVHCLRDLTRGGLASALNEIAEAAGVGIRIEERAIPVRADVRGVCELLGFDPLYVACEGRFAAFVAPADAERALGILRGDPRCPAAAIIGEVIASEPLVMMTTQIGAGRMVDMLSGEQLPRIC